jgi:hypothetical protein
VSKIFIDAVPQITVIAGMVHVARQDGDCEVWPIGTFSAYLGSGMRAVRDFHGSVRPPVGFRPKKRADH